MKKIFLTFTLTLFLLTSSVQAKTFKVVALESFSTEYPQQTFNVQVRQQEVFSKDLVIEEGTIISGRVVKISKPKRGKRNAYFIFVPTILTYEGKTENLEHLKLSAKVVGYRPVNPEKVVIYAAKKAADLAFKGASLGLSFAEGATQAKDGERIKSGIIKAYQDSPLSFIETGSELDIDTGDTLILKLKKVKKGKGVNKE